MHSRRVLTGIAGGREAEVRTTPARNPRAMAGVVAGGGGAAAAEHNCRQNKKNAQRARADAVPAGVEGADGDACGGARARGRWRWFCFWREGRARALDTGPPPLVRHGGGRSPASRKNKNDRTAMAAAGGEAVPARVGAVAVREGAQAEGGGALPEEEPWENIAGNAGGVAGVAVEGGADGGAAAAW